MSDDPAMGPRGGRRSDSTGGADVTVVVAEPPASLSGAHWANRDNDTLYRRSGRSGTFRRPPAENSFPDSGEVRHQVTGDHHHLSGQPESSEEELRARHWTTIGDGARRPRTSDRDEVNAPEVRPAAPDGPVPASWFGGPGVDPPVTGDGAAGGMPVGWPARGPQGARSAPGRPHERTAPDSGMEGLLGGPGRDIRPHRAGRRDTPPPSVGKEPRGPAPAADPPARRPRALRWVAFLFVGVLLLGGALTGVVVFTDYADGLTSVLRSGSASADSRTVTAALGGRTTAAFEVVTGTTRVAVRSEDLGDDLYRITSADDSGTVPYPVVDGDRVQLHLTPDGDGVGGGVEVLLSSKVRWALRFTGGAEEQVVDFTRGKVTAVEFVGGARRIELNLPDPAGTVGIRLRGAADEFVIKAPKTSPVRVHVDSGAKTVAAGERTLRDVKPGSTLTPRNWQAENRYDVDAVARVVLLSVQNEG